MDRFVRSVYRLLKPVPGVPGPRIRRNTRASAAEGGTWEPPSVQNLDSFLTKVESLTCPDFRSGPHANRSIPRELRDAFILVTVTNRGAAIALVGKGGPSTRPISRRLCVYGGKPEPQQQQMRSQVNIYLQAQANQQQSMNPGQSVPPLSPPPVPEDFVAPKWDTVWRRIWTCRGGHVP